VESKEEETTQFINTENRLVVARGGRYGGWAKWMKGDKRYKLPV